MLTTVSCRGVDFDPCSFGPHSIPGAKSLFDGGPRQPLLVHGYNCTQDAVTQEFGAFATLLGRDCLAYSWPGGCHRLDFLSAVKRATLAGYRFRDMLALRRQNEDIITHSLGARVVLTALNSGYCTVRNLILLGAAVDWDCFREQGEFRNALDSCSAVHILYSNRDDVLKMAFPIGDLHGDGQALGLDGAKEYTAPHIYEYDVSLDVPSHGAYLSSPEVANLVRTFLNRL